MIDEQAQTIKGINKEGTWTFGFSGDVIPHHSGTQEDGHILELVFLYKIYVKIFCVCGFSALEHGGRVEHLHIQLTFKI